MLGSVKTAVGRTSPLAILGRYLSFCASVPPTDDELGGDLGPGAERADPDIAARQLLGDDAHRDLAEPHAAIGLRDGEPEHAHLGEAGDDFERNIGVGAVPALRMRDDLGVGEAPHLAADRLEGLVEAGIADRAFGRVLDEIGKRGAVVGRVAGLDQRLDHRLVAERLDVGLAQAEVVETDDLALVHRDAAKDLGEVFAKANARHQLLGPAETALLVHAAGVGGQLLDRLDVSGEPGQSVRGVLLRLDLGGAELAMRADPFAHGGHGAFEQALGGELGLAGEIVERHGALLLIHAGWIAAAAQHASAATLLQCVFWSSRENGTGGRVPAFGSVSGDTGRADPGWAIGGRRGKVCAQDGVDYLERGGEVRR